MQFTTAVLALLTTTVSGLPSVVPIDNEIEFNTTTTKTLQARTKTRCILEGWDRDPNVDAQPGGRDCLNFHILKDRGKDGFTLGALCQGYNDDMLHSYSTIDLNRCMANRNGKLAWAENGNAFSSCQGCELMVLDPYKLSLNCMCDAGQGRYRLTTLDALTIGYGGHLFNSDGLLSCFTQFGEKDMANKYGNARPAPRCSQVPS